MATPADIQQFADTFAAMLPDLEKFSDLLEKMTGGGGVGGAVASGVAGFGQQFQRVFAVIQTGLQAVSATATAAHFALNAFGQTVQQIAGRIGGLVKLVSPATFADYERRFATFNAQLGQVFAPVLRGLGAVVQGVSNALAGLSGPGRLFLVFLAGAAVGLTAFVTVGGVFLGVLTAVVGGVIAGSTALTAFGAALDFATGGISGIGAAIGAVVGTLATAGAAAAGGGLAGLALAATTLAEFTEAMKPFLETLTGAFNAAGAAILPGLAKTVKDLQPSLAKLLELMVKFVPIIGSVLAAFASQVLPELVDRLVDLVEVALPFLNVASKLAVALVYLSGALLTFANGVVKVLKIILPFLRLLSLLSPDVPRAAGGNAPPPITGASFTGIEEAFKRAQEQALLGAEKQKEVEPIKDESVIKRWAQAIGAAVGEEISKRITAPGFVGGVANGVAAGGLNPLGVGLGIAQGIMRQFGG